VYVVQKGDTLWSISQRFTGSPYNYPRIAGENRIAEPDLIFPGQRIRLLK
jgi:nucleoid-associated protein YgaU